MTALRVMLAIAQRGSTTAAAESINLSQSAVSKQLLKLESQLGGQVFARLPSGMVPTRLGRIYIEQARIAIKAMDDAAFQARQLQPDPNTLRLKLLPIFGDRWLLPRVQEFNQKNPSIDIQYTTFSTQNPGDQPDGFFRFGPGPFPDEDALYLFGRDVWLVCAPSYLARQGNPQTLEQLARCNIFEHPGTPLHWSDLVRWHGQPELRAQNIARFDYYTLVLRAAISGQGLALVPPQLVEAEFAAGQLVNPGGIGYASDIGYWFTMPLDRKPSPALRLFRGWLQGISQTDGDGGR
ncbi:LysR substrate-binding domain-containing protein [Paracoccus pacificus]|uniref:LysR substrate-binding domain-containing protein n=1 Tax=Paracoccus pacificus TaxID=1463598 RepID=A0ABW4R2Z0_9RHOB